MNVQVKDDEAEMHWPNAVVDHEDGSVTLSASDEGFVVGCYEARPYRQAFVRLTISELRALRDAADALLPDPSANNLFDQLEKPRFERPS